MSSPFLPLLFTLPPSSRHEVLLLNTSKPPSLKALNAQITSAMTDSPNCAEFMGKYKAKPEEGSDKEVIQEIKVHWSTAGRDTFWPEATVVTEGNWEALVEMLRMGGGRDVLEIKIGKGE